jgi:hypothetical protein
LKVKPEALEKQIGGSKQEEFKEQSDLTYSPSLKFQRLMQGGLLLLALIFKSMPLVYFVFLVMGTAACFGHKLALFSILYAKIIKPTKSTQEKRCDCNPDKSEQRFACALGSFFLLMAIILSHFNFPFGWVFVGLVSALSLLAGTTNFCLGSLLFVFVRSFQLKEKSHEWF